LAGTEEIVLDAAVVVKWFSKESGHDKALRVRERHIEGVETIISLDLMLYEVANALRYNPGFGEAEVGRAVGDLINLEMDLITPSRAILETTAKNAYKYGLTVYDASYLSLAEIMGLKLLTADEQLYRRTEATGFVDLLEE